MVSLFISTEVNVFNHPAILDVRQSIGAVNCLVRTPEGKLFGCNTDYIGAITAIEDGLRGLGNNLYFL